MSCAFDWRSSTSALTAIRRLLSARSMTAGAAPSFTLATEYKRHFIAVFRANADGSQSCDGGSFIF